MAVEKRDHIEDLHVGRHFTLKKLYTACGPKEVIARNSGEYFACKVLPLMISPKVAKRLPKRKKSKSSLSSFCELIIENELKNELIIPVLSVDRPVGYFVKDAYSSTDVLEFPGGVVLKNEKVRKGGLREMMEELRVEDEQIYAYANLLKAAPFDSGSHIEFMGIVVVLIIGDINPIKGEGIRARKTRYVEFIEFPQFIEKMHSKKRIVEGYLPVSYSLLNCHLSRH